MMKHFNKLSTFVLICCSLFSRAGIEVSNARLTNPNAGTNNALFVTDNKTGVSPVIWTNKSFLAQIDFGLNEAAKQFYTAAKVKFQITFNVTAVGTGGNQFYTGQQLEVIYNRTTNQVYVDKASWVLNGFYQLQVVVTNITAYDMTGSSPVALTALPSGTYLEARIEAERYYNFSSLSLPTIGAQDFIITYLSVENALSLAWPFKPGDEEYELEWTWVNDYSTQTYNFKNNASRIVTRFNNYKLPLNYEKGYLLFRYREIGNTGTGFTDRSATKWTTGNSGAPESGAVSAFAAGFKYYCQPLNADNMNWSATATFDENGKQGTGVTFTDGLLKPRQVNSKLNTEDIIISKSTFYDFNGRPVIDLLPTPLQVQKLDYVLNNFKIPGAFNNTPFEKEAYDGDNTSSGACSYVPSPGILDNNTAGGSGAESYYSGYNTNKDGVQAYVPDAEKYPFVQVEYTPDLTGRIKSTTIPGPTHKIGSGKETKFYYVSPGTQELDRLFGSEVGQAAHYEKNIVIDANGQSSVSYLDMQGRTIATALTGNKPLQLDAIDSYAASTVTLKDNLLENNRQTSSGYILESTKTIFVASANDVQTINYEFTPANYQDMCSLLCYDCIYEVELSVKDECKNEMLDLDPVTSGFQNSIVVGNILNLDGVCTSPTSSLKYSLASTPLTLTFLNPGNYTFTKRLKVSDLAIDKYSALFLSSYNCSNYYYYYTQEIAGLDFTACGYTCAECISSVNAYATLHSLPQNVKDSLLKKCNEMCESDDDQCAVYKDQMMQDLTPGGQYATYDLSTSLPGDQVSIFMNNDWRTLALASPLINTHQFYDASQNPVSLNNVTIPDFIAQFQDEWAEAFLVLHPEYSYLEFCNATQQSLKYDEDMRMTETYDEACTKGFLNPLSISSLGFKPNTSGCNNSADPFFVANSAYASANGMAINAMVSEFGNFNSVTDLRTPFLASQILNAIGQTALPAGYDLSQFSVATGKTLYEYVCGLARNPDPNTGIMGSSDCTKDAEWELFRNIYLSKKQILYERTRASFVINRPVARPSNSNTRCFNGVGAFVNQSYHGNDFVTCNPPALFIDYSPNTSLTLGASLSGCGSGINYLGAADPNAVFNSITTAMQKERRFFDVTLFASTSVPSFGSVISSNNQTNGLVANGISSCNSNADNWMSNLSACLGSNSLPISDPSNTTLYNNIRTALINVCSSGVDASNPWGASSGVSQMPANLTPNVSWNNFASFQAVLTNYLSANGSVPGCNANLISSPGPKNGTLNQSATTQNILSACACDKIANNEIKFASLNQITTPAGVTTAVQLFNYDNHTEISAGIYNKLKCKCKSIAGLTSSQAFPTAPKIAWGTYQTTFASLNTDWSMPPEFACERCVSCSDLATAYTALTSAIPGLSTSSSNFWVIFTNYFNQTHNFELTIADYENFVNSNQNCLVINSISRTSSGSGSWISSSTLLANPAMLNNTAADLYKMLKTDAASTAKFIRQDTLSLNNNHNYFGSSLYPQKASTDNFMVKYKGYISGAQTLAMTFSKNDTINYLADTITLQEPSGYTRSFSEISDIIDFFGKPDTNFLNTHKVFYVSAVFGTAATGLDTVLLTGISNRLVFTSPGVISPPPGTPPGPTLCNKNFYVPEVDDCMTSMFNQVSLNASNLLQQEAKRALDQFIAAYKASCLSNVYAEKFERNYTLKEHHYTLYYYDQAGNLIRTVPPKGVNPLTSAADLATAEASHAVSTNPRVYPKHEYISSYQQQSYNMVNASMSPDETGSTTYFYDYLGRIVASQNPRLAMLGSGGYAYTLYDEFGRIKEVGRLVLSTTPGDFLSPATARDPAAFLTFINGHGRFEVTSTYYDASISAAIPNQFTNSLQENLRNRVATVTYEENYDGVSTTYDYATHYSYDEHGNVKEMLQDNSTLATSGKRFVKFNYEYDLVSGNVKKVYYQKDQPDQFIHKYFYDKDNRLHEVQTSKDNFYWEKDAKYFYYQHGALARTETGDKQVQGTDYAYSIQGWIKGVNSEILNSENDMGRDGQDIYATSNEYMASTANMHANFAKDAAAYTLNYFNDGTNTDYKSIKALSSATAFMADKTNLMASATGFNINDVNGNGPSLYNGNISSMVSTIIDINPTHPTAAYNQPAPQMAAYRYDQLHRIKQMSTFKDMAVTAGVLQNSWSTATSASYNNYKMQLTYDANGNIATLKRNNETGASMDDLTYRYQDINLGNVTTNTRSNKLIGVNDNTATTPYALDIEDQGSINPATAGTWNYSYDEIGSLKNDKQEHIASIDWTVDKKVRRINRDGLAGPGGTYAPDLEFQYDAGRQRVVKIVKPRDVNGLKTELYWIYTIYVRDASGNVGAVYEKTYSSLGGSNYKEILSLKEEDIYGSARLGLSQGDVVLQKAFVANSFDNISKAFVKCYTCTAVSLPTDPTSNPSSEIPVPVKKQHSVGYKIYELINHLGNVITTIADRKTPRDTRGLTTGSAPDGAVDDYLSDILSNADYYAFGQVMAERNYAITSYRYGMNGQEKDDELLIGVTSADYWEYDARLGRRWEQDPVVKPWESPYACFNNNPIYFADPSGLDGEGPNGECPGDVRKNKDGSIQKYTNNGWEAANYPNKMNSSENVFNTIKEHEGLGPNTQKDKNGSTSKAYAYDDPSGYATIGYGHLIDYDCFDPGTDSKDAPYTNGLTLVEADQLLRADVSNTYEKTIERNVKVPLTQSEFDALVVSTYNGGVGESVWKVVNNKTYDAEQVFTAFLARRSSAGVELPGLIGRRASEAFQYLYGTSPNLRDQTVKIQICTSNMVKEKSIIINAQHNWINNWNNFADRVAPIKVKQFKNYKN